MTGIKFSYEKYAFFLVHEDGTKEPYDIRQSEAWRSFFDIDIDDEMEDDR